MLTVYDMVNTHIQEQVDQAESWTKKHHVEASQPDKKKMLLYKKKKDAPE